MGDMGLMDAKSQLIQVSMSQADQLSANMTGQRRVKAVHFMHKGYTVPIKMLFLANSF